MEKEEEQEEEITNKCAALITVSCSRFVVCYRSVLLITNWKEKFGRRNVDEPEVF
jgi:hypothetical protein